MDCRLGSRERMNNETSDTNLVFRGDWRLIYKQGELSVYVFACIETDPKEQLGIAKVSNNLLKLHSSSLPMHFFKVEEVTWVPDIDDRSNSSPAGVVSAKYKSCWIEYLVVEFNVLK